MRVTGRFQFSFLDAISDDLNSTKALRLREEKKINLSI